MDSRIPVLNKVLQNLEMITEELSHHAPETLRRASDSEPDLTHSGESVTSVFNFSVPLTEQEQDECVGKILRDADALENLTRALIRNLNAN